MTRYMTLLDLQRRLAGEVIVPLAANVWSAIAREVEVVETHATGVAGDLHIVRLGDRLAAVEQPADGTRVVRRLDGEAAVREFISQRLEQYERMWDGCCCRVDYYT